MVKKRCTFKNLEESLKKPGRNSKKSKTWKKIRKPEENFHKTFGHPVNESYNKIRPFIVITEGNRQHLQDDFNLFFQLLLQA